MKLCTKCGIDKPLEEFRRHSRKKHGRDSHCKSCRKKHDNDVASSYKEPVEKKLCASCTLLKPASEFGANRFRMDGLRSYCRACARRDDKIRDLKPERKEKLRKRADEHLANHPRFREVKKIFREAMRLKKVIPQPCFICGEKAEGHHPDYDQPLSVVWLCRSHHMQAHSLIRKDR